MPRCNAADEDPEIEAIWSYPRNKLIGTLVRINQHQSIRILGDPDAMKRKLDQVLHRTSISHSAIETLCRYFFHEIKVLKGKIDDAEETVRARKADIRNLEKGCKLRITRAQALKQNDRNQALADGYRVRKNRWVAMNRKLRGKVPLEKYVQVIEDDREVIVLD
ncbi:hypothetical protein PMZ80_009885 [Knufia obscura]|uniref:Uncharacterized protein n=1 Tax=Knufia obscura TaxID=1635080 RepID=A0ABR0RAU4_9EURO|nr:hypothetical protein PMZ80_009885 [Knufia obscura]